MPAIAYNTNHGFGYGNAGNPGYNEFIYPTINYNAPEENAIKGIQNGTIKPKWDGAYFQGTPEEAKKMLISSSMFFNVETSYWRTTRGYYFEPIRGNAYVHQFDLITQDLIDYKSFHGYKMNSINETFRYTNIEFSGGNLHLYPNAFQRSRVYYKAHTHPGNRPPLGDDLFISFLLRIPGVVFGWNGITYKYGGHGYWK